MPQELLCKEALPYKPLLTCTLHVSRNIEEQKTAEVKAAAQVKAKAQAMATALQTIGKFIIKVIA